MPNIHQVTAPKRRWRVNSRGKRKWLKGRANNHINPIRPPQTPPTSKRAGSTNSPGMSAKTMTATVTTRPSTRSRQGDPPKPKVVPFNSFKSTLTERYDDCPECSRQDVDTHGATTRRSVQTDLGVFTLAKCGYCSAEFWSGKSI
jgi:hypothetical protein